MSEARTGGTARPEAIANATKVASRSSFGRGINGWVPRGPLEEPVGVDVPLRFPVEFWPSTLTGGGPKEVAEAGLSSLLAYCWMTTFQLIVLLKEWERKETLPTRIDGKEDSSRGF